MGFTPFVIIAIDNVMIIAMNAVLQKYGGAANGDMLVTCATIVQSFMLIVTMLWEESAEEPKLFWATIMAQGKPKG